ncbi:hypothetical protein CIK05_11985 [Bdellovibrio sp. qaytius]|nr:hypothetical protein CIK05_11985 [Bdellovibrio sp. qaytius]
MNNKILFRALNSALAILGITSAAYAQESIGDSNLIVTLGVPTKDSKENLQAAEKLASILNNSGKKNYTIDYDPNGLVAKVIVDEADKDQSLDSLIKKLNSQIKKKVVIIQVEPAKIVNGTQDDL